VQTDERVGNEMRGRGEDKRVDCTLGLRHGVKGVVAVRTAARDVKAET
jgi:hypothetical protein